MNSYDLFKRMADGTPYWIGTADNLPQARKMVKSLGNVTWGTSYFVRDAYDGLGHSRLSTTDRYMHELAGSKREAVQKIENLVLFPRKKAS